MTIATATNRRAKRPAPPGVCCDPECGRDAGPDPVRCTECGGAICPACAEPVIEGEPLDICMGCAVAIVRDDGRPVSLAPVLAAIEAQQARLMEAAGLREVSTL